MKVKLVNYRSNLEFRKRYPDIKIPPDFYLYETFNMNYKKFIENGIPTTQWLINHLNEFKEIKNSNILDWGCGTGRIIRHLPM